MNWLIDRLKEPSSLLSIGGLLAVVGFALPLLGEPTQASGWLIVIGAACLILGFIMREKGY